VLDLIDGHLRNSAKSTYPPSPEFRYSPKHCGEHALALRDVLRELETAGLRIAHSARLRTAARLLAQVAEAGRFPSHKQALRKVANAMCDTADFFDIAQVLRTQTEHHLLAQLQLALKGTLDDTRQRQAPYRFQTQFWLGAVLTRGGYDPRVPQPETSHPDFIVEEGLSAYGVEVKRPENAESALELVAEGAAQLRAFKVKGLIVMDLTECVGLEALSYVPIGKEEEARDNMLAEFGAVYGRIRGRVFDAKEFRLRDGFENVAGLIAIVRGWSWFADNPPGLALFATAGASTFVTPIRNVLYYHSVHLVEKTMNGLSLLGYEFEPFSKVAAPFDALPFAWRL
jgi:hypothetical protein